MKKRCLIPLIIMTLTLTALWGQDIPAQGGNTMDTSLGFTIGTVTLEDQVYSSVRLMPELSFGKLGVGLDLDFRFNMDNNDSGDTQFNVYEKDWYFSDGATFQEYLNLYLSKISYLKWAEPRDPLYVHFGNLPGSHLGTGFVMSGYTNMLFLPEKRIFGSQFNLDGELFNFPYVGVSGIIGNVSELDLYGGRLYIRPAAFTDIPVLSTLEIGGSYYTDRRPYLYLTNEDETDEFYDNTAISSDDLGDPMTILGIDTIMPIFGNNLASLMLMGDVVFQGENKDKIGSMVGAAGNITFLQYNGQVRFLGDDFQTSFFDRGYDLERWKKYTIYNNDTDVYTIIEGGTSYLASLGTSFMQNSLVFNMSVEGSFEEPRGSAETYPMDYPHVKGVLLLEEGVIDFMDFNFWYDKSAVDTYAALVSPEYAIIGGLVNFHMAPAVITLQVDVAYDPNNSDEWTVSSEIRTGIKY